VNEKQCKYCSSELLNGNKNQLMCKRCSRIHRIEYERLYYLLKRSLSKDRNSWIMKPMTCPFCDKFILGRRICAECQALRQKISDVLLQEINVPEMIKV